MGKGSHPQHQGPGFLDPLLLLLLPPSLGRPWTGGVATSDPRWRKAPQRIRGAERSLVTVGRSFTVAKGFVPLWGERLGREGPRSSAVCGSREGTGHLSQVSTPTSCPYPVPSTHPYLVSPHSPPLSPVPSDPCSRTHRGKSSGGCCSQDISFCSGGGGRVKFRGKRARKPLSFPLPLLEG